MASRSNDLTGTWNGLYSYGYGIGGKRVNFVAMLTQVGDSLSGTIEEQELRSSDLVGTSSGASVEFVKTYRGAHSVDYNGHLDADGNEIEGTWTLPGGLNGRFLMIRAPEVTVSASRKVTAKV